MNLRTLLTTATVTAIFFSSCSKKDAEPPKEKDPVQQDIAAIDAKITDWMTQNGMPGLSLAISKNGKLVYRKGYGESDKETHEKVTADSRFRIASVSKLLTSVAVMKLVQDNKVTLQHKVFGPEGILGTEYGTLPYKQYVTDITVSDLLHHTSGGWGQDNDPAFFDKDLDANEVINWTIDNLPLTDAPGSSFAYSNFGYMLLAKIIEEVSGRSYDKYVSDEIWNSVGATSSEIAGTKLTERKKNEVKYYGQAGDINYVYDNTNFIRANGAFGWTSTTTDMLRFVNAVDSSATRPDILSLPTIKTMVTPTAASTGFGGMIFGCGWVIENGEWFWWGSLPGTFAILYRNSNGICVAAAANSRKQPTPDSGLYSFVPIINFVSFDNSIPWQDIDQFD